MRTDPAPPALDPMAGGAGEVGKTPWRCLHEHDALAATVKDSLGNDLFTAAKPIAQRACIAVNSYTNLLGDNTMLRDGLRALSEQVHAMPHTPAVLRALDLIATTLKGGEDEA